MRILRAVHSGWPLPLGLVRNKRSQLYVGNLASAIVACLDHPAAAGKTYLVSDGEDLSTPELVRRMGQALGRPARLVPVPVGLMRLVGGWVGKVDAVARFTGSLTLDASPILQELDWKPPFTLQQGLQATADWMKSPEAEGVSAAQQERRQQACPSLATRALLRALDGILAAAGLAAALPLLLVLMVLGWFDTGSPLFLQQRVGRGQKPFTLIKFRTMSLGTQSVATHLANPASVTKLGGFLRRTKLDELPQLWNVLKGDMSLVGPRPCLFNQAELITERASRGIFDVRPGITGLAQVQGIDMSTPRLLAETDARMLQTLGLKTYVRYIMQTVFGAGSGDRIKAP
jgi:lipopolysaccharide/colanic/teichoic acid biosynthesis glycosyltransferase